MNLENRVKTAAVGALQIVAGTCIKKVGDICYDGSLMDLTKAFGKYGTQVPKDLGITLINEFLIGTGLEALGYVIIAYGAAKIIRNHLQKD